MALGKAAIVGLIAALALPSVMRGDAGELGEWAHWWSIRPIPGNFDILFSIPIFVVVTLFAWMFIGWASRE